MRLDDSAGLHYIWNPEEVESMTSKRMDLAARVRASRPRESLEYQKMLPRLKVDLPTSENLNYRWVFPLPIFN